MSLRANVLLWAQRVHARRGSQPHVLLEISESATPEQVQEAFHKIARTAHPDLHRTVLDPEELELVTSAYAAVAAAYQQMRSAVMQTTRLRAIKPDALDKLGATGDPRSITPPDSRPVTPPSGSRTATATPPSGAHTVQPRAGSEPRSARPRAGTDSGVRSMPHRPRPRAGTGADEPQDGPKPAGVSATGSRPPGSLPQPAVPITPSGAAPTQNAAQAMSPKALLYYRKAEMCLKRGDLKGAILQLKLACATDPSSVFLRTALAEVETEVRKNP